MQTPYLPKRVFLYDTTLRDGTQGEGTDFSTADKVRIARALDDAGFAYLEGGYPASNPRDEAFFAALAQEPLHTTRLAAFGMTMKANSESPQTDSLLQPLITAQTPALTLVGKSWDMQVRVALQTTLERNLEIIEASVRYCRESCEELLYDAEHFFDGWKNNADYARKTLQAAVDGGANWLVLCDTNGGTMPWEIEEITSGVCAWIRKQNKAVRIGIHCHNDTGNGVACSLAGVRGGAEMVQGTVGGIGERTGNADIIAVAATLTLKMGIEVLPQASLATLTDLTTLIFEMQNKPVPNNLPYTGRSAFAHKGGMHASAIARDSETYEHINPEVVGNRRRFLVSDLAGRANMAQKMKELGFPDLDNATLGKILEELKAMEHKGYVFEGADASLQLLAEAIIANRPEPFTVKGFRITDVHYPDQTNFSEATIEIEVKGNHEHTAAMGNGPVNALDRAFRKALINFFPELKKIELREYKVRVLAGDHGTSSHVRVLISSWDGTRSWQTVGVSEDVIDASFRALADSYRWYLQQNEATA